MTAIETTSIDTILEAAAQRWSAWRAEHPMATRYRSAAEADAAGNRAYEAFQAICRELTPADARSLLDLAGDPRIWRRELSLQVESVEDAVRLALEELIDEVTLCDERLVPIAS